MPWSDQHGDPAHPIRVLIVDDHAMVAESLRRVLDAAPDIRADTIATSADEALREVRRSRPDVAIVDYRLGADDGVSVGRLLRDEHADLALLLMSGAPAGNVIAAALDAGFSGCIDKAGPIDRLAPSVRLAHAGELVLAAADLARLFPAASDAHSTDLSPREIEILVLMQDGHTNKAMAATLILSVNTVRKHVQSILGKLDAHSKLEAVAIARRRGLLDDR